MAIINYEELEPVIIEIENVLTKHDVEEQELIIKIISKRFTNKRIKEKQNESARDIVNQLMPKSLKGLMGGKDEE